MAESVAEFLARGGEIVEVPPKKERPKKERQGGQLRKRLRREAEADRAKYVARLTGADND